MNKNEIGQMLALANIEAEQIAKLPGVKGVYFKVPIIAMIIQNVYESLLALDKGVDVTGVSISMKEIGEGLSKMLEHLRDEALWKKLQEGLSPEDVNKTVKLTGRISAAANALKSIT